MLVVLRFWAALLHKTIVVFELPACHATPLLEVWCCLWKPFCSELTILSTKATLLQSKCAAENITVLWPWCHTKSAKTTIVRVLQSGTSDLPWTGMSGFMACCSPTCIPALRQPCTALTRCRCGQDCSSGHSSLLVSPHVCQSCL